MRIFFTSKSLRMMRRTLKERLYRLVALGQERNLKQALSMIQLTANQKNKLEAIQIKSRLNRANKFYQKGIFDVSF